VGVKKVSVFLRQDAPEPSDVGRAVTAPQSGGGIFPDRTPVPYAQSGIRKERAELRIGRHQRHTVICARQFGPGRKINEKPFGAADFAGNDDVNDFRTGPWLHLEYLVGRVLTA
jgi:hypothetical protein